MEELVQSNLIVEIERGGHAYQLYRKGEKRSLQVKL
jgi:hypothetical protein